MQSRYYANMRIGFQKSFDPLFDYKVDTEEIGVGGVDLMTKYVYEVNRGCTYCGGCICECPQRAIRMTPSGAFIIKEKCVGCGLCAANCASEAITKVPLDGISLNK